MTMPLDDPDRVPGRKRTVLVAIERSVGRPTHALGVCLQSGKLSRPDFLSLQLRRRAGG
ncbi:hypothetical protein GGD63_005829 [Bradyrhizobium sp. cir1]|uniref:hypothetical protein n=1 Tax=Bradyrhizobium sp. cir1 TaxID=1445730 RepID=UPI001807FA85|nr:hypothetical protein [Bradyrhizobium sp. cir1]MBB4373014.1 hypothetical protein [Bradyrhizobium sp. cir1]